MKSIHIYACALVLSGCCLVANQGSTINDAIKAKNAELIQKYRAALQDVKDTQIALNKRKLWNLTSSANKEKSVEVELESPTIGIDKPKVEEDRLKIQLKRFQKIASSIHLNLKRALTNDGVSESDAEIFLQKTMSEYRVFTPYI